MVNSSEDGSCGSPTRMDTEEEDTSSSENDSSAEDDTIHIELNPSLREVLEQDYFMAYNKNKVNSCPCY